MTLQPFEMMAPVEVGDGADLFEVQSLGVTNLDAAGEKGVRVEAGDNYRITLPDNWDPGDFTISCWFVPDFDSDDGELHRILDVRGDGNNTKRVVLDNLINGNTRCFLDMSTGGTNASVQFDVPFSAGDAVFVGARYDGTAWHGYVATASAGSLSTDSAAFSETTTATTWLAAPGGDLSNPGDNVGPGALNLLVTSGNGDSADPVTDRYSGGDGMALDGEDGWFGRHGDTVVLHVGTNADGDAVQLDTASTDDGATDFLEGDAEGRYDFNGTGGIACGDIGADGATKLIASFEFEMEEIPASNRAIFEIGDWASDGQFLVYHGNGVLNVAVPDSATDTTVRKTTSTVLLAANTRKRVWVVYDGTEATSADRVKIYAATYDPDTRQYGAVAEVASTESGTIPASLRTTADNELHIAERQDGEYPSVGIFDDFRIAVGSVFDPTTEFDPVNEAAPHLWDHWWPFDGDATDVLGGLDGTVTGATQVADGRHHHGRFERYTRQGLGYFEKDLNSAQVDFGDWTMLDGATGFSMLLFFRMDELGDTEVIFSRFTTGDNSKRQFRIYVIASGTVRVELYDLDDGLSEYGALSGAIDAGTWYALWVRYDGTGATNADRLRTARSTYDPDAGEWSAFVEDTLAFNGTIPDSLTTLTDSAVSPIIGNQGGSSARFGGYIDEIRVAPYAMDVATLNAQTIYEVGAEWNGGHVWKFDGDYTDAQDHTGKTFSRSDAAFQTTGAGLLSSQAANVLRDNHVVEATDGNRYRTTLLEGDGDNEILDPRDLTTANWGFTAATARDATGIDGVANTATTVTDADGASALLKAQSVVIPDDSATHAWSLYIAKDADETRFPGIDGRISGGTLQRLLVQINTATGATVVEASAGTVDHWVEDAGDFWRLVVVVQNNASGNTNARLDIYPARATVFGTAAGSATGSCVVDGVQLDLGQAFPSSFTEGTRDGDLLQEAVGFSLADLEAAGGATFYTEFVDLGANLQSGARYWFIGGPGSNDRPFLQFYNDITTGRLRVDFNTSTGGTGFSSSRSVVSGSTFAQHVAARLVIFDDAGTWKMELHASFDGAAEVSSGAVPLDSTITESGDDWSQDIITLGATPAGSLNGFFGFIALKIQSGPEQSLAEMQALDDPDLYSYRAGDSFADLDGTATDVVQWYDGRQPEGWTDVGTVYKDRQRDTPRGTWAVRVYPAPIGGAQRILKSITGLTEGQWIVFQARGEGTDTILRLSSAGIASSVDLNDYADGSFSAIGHSEIISSDATGGIEVRATAGTWAVVSEIVALELGLLSADTATKDLPTRVLFSISRPGFAEPWVVLAVAADESFEGHVRDAAGTQVGPAGGDTAPAAGWHTVGIGFDGTDLYVVIDGEVEATVVQPDGDFDDLAEVTIGALRTLVTSHFLGLGTTTDVGRILVWDNPLDEDARRRAHNALRDEYPALTEVSG